MNRERARLLQLQLLVLDIATTAGAFLVAYWIRGSWLDRAFGEIYPLPTYFGIAAAGLVSVPLLFVLLEVYDGEGASLRKSLLSRDMAKLLQGIFLVYVLLSVLAFSLKLHYVSRLLVMLFVVIDLVLLALVRLQVWPLLYRRAHREPLRVAVVGSGPKARDLASILGGRRGVGISFLGFVVENGPALDRLDGHPVLGRASELESILHRQVVDEVLVALPERSPSELEPLLRLCERQGITARVVCDYPTRARARVYLDRLEDVPLLTFTTVPNDSNLLALKRVTDVVLSGLLLLVTSPLFVIVPLLIKLTSSGPVLYKQIRCGLNGRRFTFYKFRSMVEGADEQRDEIAHLNEAKGPIFKISSDPRVTAIGRFLRKTSIDELPQLFNVLKGEMSLVGPRPPLPQEVELYEPWQRRRMSMKPGLTCLWQVSGRSVLSFEEWVDLDLHYIDNWSLGQDFRILIRTIPAVLSRRGAW